MNGDLHLEGLTLIEKRLTKAYAVSVSAGVRTLESCKPERLQPYIELEIAERDIQKLAESVTE